MIDFTTVDRKRKESTPNKNEELTPAESFFIMNFKRCACGYGSGSESETEKQKLGPSSIIDLSSEFDGESTHGLEMSCFELCASYRYWDARSYLWKEEIFNELDLRDVLDRQVIDLNLYMFDEPSSYLDVKQRLNAARTIRSLLQPDRYVIVVEHDLSVLDYLSDFICVPIENLRFREESLSLKERPDDDKHQNRYAIRKYIFFY
ncbi:ABC transporter E family member 2 [Gigaspora margarita]|uniref:ABC transporter E family member 2 n=1 Tax=Gigaspora margarita TaxID=4874 RepID=A0A8H3X8E7_GIGMA|nr:ABC transporter E family member 2 [Gigaspora margarita]